jgi:hypothetical protein
MYYILINVINICTNDLFNNKRLHTLNGRHPKGRPRRGTGRPPHGPRGQPAGVSGVGGRGPARKPPPPLLLSYLAKPRALVPLIPLYIVDRWRQENTQLIIEICLCFSSPHGSFKSCVGRETTIPSTRERLLGSRSRSSSATLLERSRERPWTPYVCKTYEVRHLTSKQGD